MAPRPLTIPPTALDRVTGSRWGSVRRWRPLEPDDSDLVQVHTFGRRGGGLDAIADLFARPLIDAHLAAQTDLVIDAGIRRLLDDLEDLDDGEEVDR